MRRVHPSFVLVAAVLGWCTGALEVAAQPPTAHEPGYRLPPQAIVDILDAAPFPGAQVSPTGDTMVLLERRSLPPIEDLARPMLRLAGHRLDPVTSGPARRPDVIGLSIVTLPDGATRPVALPERAAIWWTGYADDGRRFAFAAVRDDRVELWTLDLSTGQARAIEGVRLNGAFGRAPCEWLRDARSLLCAAVPASRPAPPDAPRIPTGPNIQESSGRPAPVRTYQDLLASPHDEALFEHYFTSQLVLVDAIAGKAAPIGSPGIYSDASASPDGSLLLIERLAGPFSRLVPSSDFPREFELWGRDGRPVKTLTARPLADTVPINGVPTGPRAHRWHAGEPATLVWAEALDGGDPRSKVPHRDRVLRLDAKAAAAPVELMKTALRVVQIAWTEDGTALLTEYEHATRWTRTWVLAPGGVAPRALWDRSAEDAYRHPGTPVTRTPRGAIRQSGRAIFLTGAGASPEGDRPFLDRLDLDTFETARLFQGDGPGYELPLAVLDNGTRLVTRRESRTAPPNYVWRDLAAGTDRALTRFTDPARALSGAEKRLFAYTRADGVALSATLYLPPGYTAGTRLPMLVWAYPREFVDPGVAGQVTGSPHRFTTVTGASHLLLLTQGYAILDDPSMPIVGPGETANDTYVEQLVASAQAAVDAVVEMGVADRHRVAVGGHSYGAFMAANLLAHSDIFRAGIARSGAYNRTLTPFGFQNESRTFWEVPDIYARMSPFWHAHRVDEPILLIHGEADNNSGTFPMQSERFYMALKGHGATVRYVTLPHESHGYAARESVLHTVAEMLDWMNLHVRDAKPRAETIPTAGR
jgi:dipeptidyl aminopeptidase/acylaminoacyl peptidase